MKKAMFVVTAASALSCHAEPLFSDGHTRWAVLTETRDAPVVYAAQEFTNAIWQISGVAMPIVDKAKGPAVRIRVCPDGKPADRVVVSGSDTELVLSGNSPRAALHATYWFLQRKLGVRWLWPGDDGAFFPVRKSFPSPSGISFDYTPQFVRRGLHLCGSQRLDEHEFKRWMVRNMMSYQTRPLLEDEEKFGLPSIVSGHNLTLVHHKDLFATHPEYFAEVNGERTIKNICLNCDDNIPILVDQIVSRAEKTGPPPDMLRLSLADNGAYCQCAICAKSDRSTNFFRFLAKVVARFRERWPKTQVGTIAYQGYRPVPKCPLPENLHVDFCTHWRCNIHLVGDPSCPDTAREQAAMDEWDRSGNLPVGEYGYYYDVFARNDVMLPIWSILDDAVNNAFRRGHVAMYTEIGLSRKANLPAIECDDVRNRVSLHFYVSKLWDPTLTLDDWMDDFCRTAYGPAASAVKKYFMVMDRAWIGRKGVHTGILRDGINSVLSIMTDATRSAACSALDEAERAVAAHGTERFRANVARERQLYGQWESLLALRIGGDVTMCLPVLADAMSFPAEAASEQPLCLERRPSPAKVRAAWTKDASGAADSLVVEFSGLDGGLLGEEASVEFGLANAADKWTFCARNGTKTGAKYITDIGVPDPLFKPNGWKTSVRNDTLTFTVPFADIGVRPRPGATWEARFALGRLSLPAKKELNAKLIFVNKPFVDRRMVIWTGNEKDVGKLPGWKVHAEKLGYKAFTCTRITQLEEALPGSNLFFFRMFNPRHMTNTYYGMIAEAVRNGATVVLAQSVKFPMKTVFDGLTRQSDGWVPVEGIAKRHDVPMTGVYEHAYGKGRVVVMEKGLCKFSPPEAAAAIAEHSPIQPRP